MDSDGETAEPAAHERRLRTRAWLLACWFLLSFGAMFFARELSSITLFGWPLSYWLAAQGCVLGFLAITAIDAGLHDGPDGRADAASRPRPGDD